jgi:hypothetical protein
MRYEVRLCRDASFYRAGGLAVLGAGRLTLGLSCLGEASLTAGIIDSQSLKAAEKGAAKPGVTTTQQATMQARR